eukprot:Tamp_23636.p6 GENE.Tamp_23636~~Tamp_23636.p6  ORF type:complete len:111 (+),score=7.20 Tamp_23636:649-981(+)
MSPFCATHLPPPILHLTPRLYAGALAHCSERKGSSKITTPQKEAQNTCSRKSQLPRKSSWRLQLITCHVPGPCISHCLTCIHAFALHTLLSVVQKITPEEAVKEGAGDKP